MFISIVIVHWYLSIFVQSFFYHRYSAHRHFKMTMFCERIFFILSWLIQGFGYMSPTTYGVMHRLHHANTDKTQDPHSPVNNSNIFKLYKDTVRNYIQILKQRVTLSPQFYKQIPHWKSFDELATSKYSRYIWLTAYGRMH